VGSERQVRVAAHQSLICKSFQFFACALRRGWKESTERLVILPEDDPEVFSSHLH
jgi:hypothetical protein